MTNRTWTVICLGLLFLCPAPDRRAAAGSAGAQASEASGVVVEQAQEGFAAQKAGLQPGDVLLRWQRAASPPANPEPVGGEVTHPFDLWVVEVEQAPRGGVTLLGKRGGAAFSASLSPGRWRLTVRPQLAPEELEVYAKARELAASEDPAQAGKALVLWGELESAWRPDRPDLASWISFERARLEQQHQLGDGGEASFERALEAAGGNHAAWTIVLYGRWAKTLESRSRWNRMEELYRASLGAQAGESLAVSGSLNSLGFVASSRGDLESAEGYYRRSLEMRERLAPGSLAVAQSLINLGNVARKRGDLDSAEDSFRRSLAIWEKLAPQSLEVATSLDGLGVLAWSRGDLESAENHIQRALAIREKLAPQSPDVAASLNNLGMLAAERGHLGPAEDYFRRALAMNEKLLPQSVDVASNLNNLGNVVLDRGDLGSAEDYYRRSLTIWEKLTPQSPDVAASLNNLGIVASEQGDLGSAEDYFRRALAMNEKLAPRSVNAAEYLDNLGSVALSRGDLDSAEDYFRRSLEIYEEVAPRSVAIAEVLRGLGDMARARSDLDSAEAHYERSLAIRRERAPGSAVEAESCQRLGVLHRRRDELARAIAFYDCAIAALEAQRGRVGGSDEARSTFAARYAGIYREAIDLMVQVGKNEEAFYLLERYRARELVAQLASRELIFSSDLPEELEARRRVANRRYDRAYRRWMELPDDAGADERQGARKELTAARRRQDEIRAEVRAAAPRLAALQHPEPLDLGATRAALDPGTLLLSYSVGEERSYLFAVEREGPLAVFPLAVGEAWLQAEMERLREALARGRFDRRPERYLLHARELSRRLLDPVAGRIEEAERLLVLADGPLHALPFAALTDPGASDPPRFLVEAKPLHLAASATVFALLKEERRGRRATLLTAFGDPLFPGTAPRDEQLAPQLRSALRNGLDLAPLPGTRAEVESLRRLYPQASRIFLGADATEARAKAVGGETTLLHIASHGLLDDRHPLDSALVLSIPPSWHEGEDNGLLQAWEVFEQLRIDADLVTLSGCDTGLGKVLGGEGLQGLTRAFQYAGARSVLASLWGVADASAGELMERFYLHLKEGQSKAEALRSAQLELLHGSELSHPYHWAGFELFGDWR